MPLPATFKVLLKDQALLEILGAARVTRRPFRWYDGSTYRNTMPNNVLVVRPTSLVNTQNPTTETNTASVNVPGTPTTPVVATASGTTSRTADSRNIVDDVAAGIEPRPHGKVRELVEFWAEDTVGIPMKLTGTLASGNATIVVPNNRLITPGQALAGSGIPADAIFLWMNPETTTAAILSHKATSTGDQELTLSGSDLLAYYWDDEGIGGAEAASILV